MATEAKTATKPKTRRTTRRKTTTRKAAATKAAPKTDTTTAKAASKKDLTITERLDRIESTIGPQLGVKLSDRDEEAVMVAAAPDAASHTMRPLTDIERLTRLELAVGAAGIKLYTKE